MWSVKQNKNSVQVAFNKIKKYMVLSSKSLGSGYGYIVLKCYRNADVLQYMFRYYSVPDCDHCDGYHRPHHLHFSSIHISSGCCCPGTVTLQHIFVHICRYRYLVFTHTHYTTNTTILEPEPLFFGLKP